MTVVERMARAIWDDREQHQNERCRQSWERGSELARQFAMDHARAALTALRDSFADPVVRAAIQAALDEKEG
ncbi:hypothetical protein [Sphingomonas aerolata]|uniref:hypothetical protein n=1 Tax=Sphingomonas aerolata TaxID=185951 RepID=UPI00141B4D60|nr:hypothetical protein [Sphingomonas aerolata]NII59869.1 hypothetical protein [Sphingomonas aerolata]